MASGTSRVSTYTAASSAFYQSSLISTGVQRETLGDRLNQTRTWIYNHGQGTVMGRTPIDWLLLIGCNVAFLVGLLAMTSAFCGILYWLVGWNYPKLRGAASILQTPGIGFRPQPNIETTLIRFIKGDYNTYIHYLDHIEAYIQYYENELQQGDNFMDCSEIRTRRTTNLNKVCVFDPIVLGGDCVKQQNYGFDDGQPCILLKLNKELRQHCNWCTCLPRECCWFNQHSQDYIHRLNTIQPHKNGYWRIFRNFGDGKLTREDTGHLPPCVMVLDMSTHPHI